MGGVFNPINLDGYQYVGQNPVRLLDADGNVIITMQFKAEGAFMGGVAVYSGKVFEIHNGKIKAFEGSGFNVTSGYRLDAGFDFCYYSTNTVNEWKEERWGSITGDAGPVGGGVLFGGDGEVGFNFSLGGGFGGSAGASGDGMGGADYTPVKLTSNCS